jgi:hypothetical protein
MRKEQLGRAKEFSIELAEKTSFVAAAGEEEMANYIGGSLREDEFFDRGFHQLH